MTDAKRMEEKWEGREDCECGEHVTTNDRTWCLEDKEWCYPDAPCRGCELPILRAEVERLRGRILQWAADRCDDPLDHSQEHTPLGVPAGYCGKCGMRYPCPSILAALEAKP